MKLPRPRNPDPANCPHTRVKKSKTYWSAQLEKYYKMVKCKDCGKKLRNEIQD